MTKPTKWSVLPVKTQISLCIFPVWSESSQCTQWVAKHPRFLHADSEDSDQTGRISRLICVFAGRTDHFVGFILRWLIWTMDFYHREMCLKMQAEWQIVKVLIKMLILKDLPLIQEEQLSVTGKRMCTKYW